MRSSILATLVLTGVVASLEACGGQGSSSQFESGTNEDAAAPPSPPVPAFVVTDAGTVPDATPSPVIDCDASPGACAEPGVCGDGKAGLGESCDDGNTADGDGCSSKCQIEAPYWACAFGEKCIDVRDCSAFGDAGDGGCVAPPKEPVCGDSFIDPGEACDDGNVAGTDGCSADCKAVEANYICSTPGEKCTSTMVCGDGKITGTEQCDDKNLLSNDGCSATCQIESGWTCLLPGVECTATSCGDGLLAGGEECDDGNTADNDGCSATCRLQSVTEVIAPTTTTAPKTIIHNFTCFYPDPLPTPVHQICVETVCGNGVIEPNSTEQCDDNNTAAFDGCSPTCQLEPKCPNGTCVAKCGDGLLFDFDGDNDGTIDEECDDGNLKAGDGCSASCKVEQGYKCEAKEEDFPEYLDLPVVLRDFKYANGSDPEAHPDFESFGCSRISPGLVDTALSSNGIPTLRWDGANNDPLSGTDTNGDCGKQLTSSADFNDWYQDVDVTVGGNPVRRSKRITDVMLRLTRQGTPGDYSYVSDSTVDEPYKTSGGFYPIDGRGWGNQGGNAHNFAFTTELRYWFTYDATTSPRLDFSGDDDVWVFINGKLALDVGGLHPRQNGSFTLDPTKAIELGLVDKHLYEIALFHAERHTNQSNFWLTLRGFVKKHSSCTHVCGDNIKTREEQCDDGAANADPSGVVPYGACTTSCTLGPYCGDKVTTNPPEQCDDGVNLTLWTPAESALTCAPGCKIPVFCGDEIVQSSFGEQCDRGAANTDDSTVYNACRKNCTLGARCGDGAVNETFGEQCDNGFNLTSYVKHPTDTDCAPSCKRPRSCGDGNVDFPFEQCDQGAANTSSGAYGSCTVDCTLGPRCGDGIPQAPEQCDDGNRLNGDGCSAACLTEGSSPK